MKKIICSVVLLGFSAGAALLLDSKAEACDSFQLDSEGKCTCLHNKLSGYVSCQQFGETCVATGRCGNKPPILPF